MQQMRHQLLRPQLESILSGISCSTLTRHLWSHVRDMDFDTKKEMFAYIRSNIEVEVISKCAPISHMTTASTKNCTLCMREKINLFFAFGRKNSRTKLMNSRNELYGKCRCKTRFLRLSAVGNGGADEAASQPKTVSRSILVGE